MVVKPFRLVHLFSCLALSYAYLPSRPQLCQCQQTTTTPCSSIPSTSRSMLTVSRQDDPSWAESDNLTVTINQRRRLLQRVAATLAVGGLSPQKALAATASSAPSGQVVTAKNKRIGGLVNKIRNVGGVMDELQRDLMQERWDLVEGYPAQLRSYVPLFTTYTDSAFPSDAPIDKGLRVALRYEVGRYFASLERFKQAVSRKALDEAYIAFADMSLHFDRYMRVGGLYSYYDDIVSLEPYYKGISDDSLVYANPGKDPAIARDLVILVKGPDKGKTGIVLGRYPDGSDKCVVKLDRFKGMREIRVVSNSWVAKRLGEQDPDDVFLIPRKS